MTSAEDVIEVLGRKQIREFLGVGNTAISNALCREGKFPASWYGPIRQLCDEAGVDCPLSAFNWKQAKGAA